MNNHKSLADFYPFFIYLAGFLLFWEWLRPLATITDTGSVYVFVIYTAICFGVSYYVKNPFLVSFIKLMTLFIAIDYLFLPEQLFSPAWFDELRLHVGFNIDIIMQQEWQEMTALFRSLLFFLLLWLMSYLLHYWFLIAKRFFLFILLTFIYVAIVDTFTMYDGSSAIVRTFVISLVAMGITHYMKENQGEKATTTAKELSGYWIIPLLAMVVLATVVGYFAPKFDPQWPDPVPFIKSTAENAGFQEGDTVRKVGYGEDDSRLGGSFLADDSPVFEAIAPKRQYWRIESKDIYTGKGWGRSSDLNYLPLEDGIVEWESFSSDVETTDYQASIQFAEETNLPKVVYPYGVARFNSGPSTQFFMDNASGMIEAELSEQDINLSYLVEYQYPSFSVDRLQEVEGDDPESIRDRYLQLPDELPERVRELAAEVVDEDESRYEKAKKIESYFSNNGFLYQTEDVPVPEGDEDYVDQFLFETQVGYCDNFSTSMVVMLRSLDIPARWVKGFTGGEMAEDQPSLPPEYQLYEVTNNNAHSWVEVFFPDIGWVPFEPTSGFVNPVDFYEEASTDPNNPNEPTTPEEDTTPEEEEETEETAGQELDLEDENALGAGGDGSGSGVNLTKWIITVSIIALVALLFMVYRKRDDIKRWYWKKRAKKRLKEDNVEHSYNFLLMLLEKKVKRREKGQTLREYAKTIDDWLLTDDMSKITSIRERNLYRENTGTNEKDDFTELFENLIGQILP
ncbi:transglutaminase-like domain-containing protein [Saliterribacillus persicus]|uniref:Transglutaminase-like putative cysteine protease n=1 Tax=Saliterribacillus persicus TaxID=930114 RepID=A0A368XDA6_9BACI|nr:transglutaminase family protein [Saliterribacillus persicus]RCW65825.1 transglutaminase-like putative cysteine protease [Saliterribacillus persicus]